MSGAGAPHGNPWRRRWNGVGARLAQLLAVMLLPPLGFLAYQAVSVFDAERRQQAVAVANSLELISRYEREFFERTHALLRRTAEAPAVRLADVRCNAVLADAAAESAAYLQLVLVDADGQIRCGSAGGNASGHTQHGSLVRRVLAGSAYELGEVVSWEDGRRTAVLGAAVLVDAPYADELVLVLTIDLAEMQGAIHRLELPANGVAVLADREGRLLLADLAQGYAAFDRLPANTPLAPLVRTAPLGIDALGRDGQLRRYLARPLAQDRLFVVTGVPVAGDWAWLSDRLLVTVAAGVAFLVLSMTVIVIAADWLINRHVRRLAALGHSYFDRGDAGWAALDHAPTELADLGRAFQRMTERVADREQSLERSLADKEVLLKEVHHRVKNNLQTVISLLALRSRRTASPIAREAIAAAQTRIRALALLHTHLYQQEDIRRVALRPFLTELCGLVETAVDGVGVPVTLHLDVAPIDIDAERAIPLALLVVEAVSNAYEHAFEGRASGNIAVTLRRLDEDRLELQVADDGIGIGDGANGGLGLTLARLLAGQIGGELRLGSGTGTTLVATFPRRGSRGGASDRRAAVREVNGEADAREHEKQNGQDLADADRGGDDAAETEQAGNRRNAEEHERELEHDRPFRS